MSCALKTELVVNDSHSDPAAEDQPLSLLGSETTQPSPSAPAAWTPQLLLSTLACIVSSSMLFGYNMGVINTPEQTMKEFFNSTYILRTGYQPDESLLTTLWAITVGAYGVGGIISGATGSIISGKLGRKRTTLWNNLTTVISCAMMFSSYWAQSYELLIAGRFVAGLQSGLSTAVAPQYLNEIAPLALRGSCGTAHELAIVVGILLSNVITLKIFLGSQELWPYALAVPVIPAIFHLLISPFCPESPEWLYLYKNRHEDSRKALCYLRNTKDVRRDLASLEKSAKDSEYSTQTSVVGLFKEPYLRKALLIAVTSQIAQQLCGINAVVFFSTSIFDSARLSPSTAGYLTMGTGLTQVLMNVVASAFVVEWLGRRPLLLGGCVGLLASLVVLVVSLGLQDSTMWLNYVAVGAIFVYVFFFSMGPGPIAWYITAEVFEPSARPAAIGVAIFVNWTCATLVALGFPILQEAAGFYAFLPFITILSIATILLFVTLPETKNKPTTEIVQLLKGSRRSSNRS